MANSWMNVTDFKAQTGITIDDAVVQQALMTAAYKMRRYISYPDQYQSTTQKNQHILSRSTPSNPIRIYIGDYNMDGVITKDDLMVYEIDQNFNEYDLSTQISTFNYKYGVVNFLVNVPTSSNRILFIDFTRAIGDIINLMPMMIELNKLEATNWLFTQIPFANLQSGISQWNLNGVNISFDLDAINKIIQANNDRIKALYNLLIPLFDRKTVLQAPTRNKLTDFMTTLTFRSP